MPFCYFLCNVLNIYTIEIIKVGFLDLRKILKNKNKIEHIKQKGIFLFYEFDAIGTERATENNVGEM